MKRVLLLLTILSLLVPSLSWAQRNETKEKSKLTGKATVNGHLIDGSTQDDQEQLFPIRNLREPQSRHQVYISDSGTFRFHPSNSRVNIKNSAFLVGMLNRSNTFMKAVSC